MCCILDDTTLSYTDLTLSRLIETKMLSFLPVGDLYSAVQSAVYAAGVAGNAARLSAEAAGAESEGQGLAAAGVPASVAAAAAASSACAAALPFNGDPIQALKRALSLTCWCARCPRCGGCFWLV